MVSPSLSTSTVPVFMISKASSTERGTWKTALAKNILLARKREVCIFSATSRTGLVMTQRLEGGAVGGWLDGFVGAGGRCVGDRCAVGFVMAGATPRGI